MTLLIGVAVAIVVIVALTLAIVKVMWKVAEPNEALVISGGGAMGGQKSGVGDPETPTYKIVVGHGVLVIPGLQTVRRLSLNARKADLTVEAYAMHGIPISVRGVVVYKVGNTPQEIANAASRFLGDKPEAMANLVDELFSGHLRSILGGLTMEEITGDRAKLASQTRDSSAQEMETLGLKIDSLQIQEFSDPSGYIKEMARPYQEQIASTARIAAAQRQQEAVEREQEAAAIAARATSDSQIAQAEVLAMSEQAQAKAAQAGPLASAEAQKEVVVTQTEVAKLEAARKEQELIVQTVRPAEAARDAAIASAEADKQRAVLAAQGEAEAQTVRAEADAKARTVTATAEAGALQAIGEANGAAKLAELSAEAEGLQRRATALREGQEAVIAQTVAESLPEIVAAASGMFKDIDSLTVLDGAQGMGGFANEAVKIGLGMLPLVRSFLRAEEENGSKEEQATETWTRR